MRTVARVIVGVSEFAIASDPETSLVTYSLGSCVGLSLYDTHCRIGGLLHAMLPLSSSNPGKAAERPATFVDSGIAAMLQELFALGATRRSLEARVAGGAQNLDTGDLFRIGERNYTVLRRMLWRNGILIAGESVGGSTSRTMRLDIATGDVLLRMDGTETRI